jgi:hypothetical protein
LYFWEITTEFRFFLKFTELTKDKYFASMNSYQQYDTDLNEDGTAWAARYEALIFQLSIGSTYFC